MNATQLLVPLLGLIGCGASADAELALPRLTHETRPVLRTEFNRASDRPRVIIFFSSGCAACDSGSAALQAMLDTVPGPIALFAVWEPIAATDAAPTSHMLGNLKDRRVHQLWDPSHIISGEMRSAELAHPGSPPQARTRTDSRPDGIMYDTLVVFRPGARWEATLPAADYLEVGLAAKLDELRDRLLRFSKAR